MVTIGRKSASNDNRLQTKAGLALGLKWLLSRSSR